MNSIRENVVYGDTTPFKWEKHSYALSYDVGNADEYHLVLLDLEEPTNDCILKGIDNIELRRPAGKMVHMNGINIRPAQKCVNDYGEGLVFYEYGLEGKNYIEKELQQVLPQDLKYSKEILMDGMHTYNRWGEYEVIDLKTRRFNILNFVFRMLGKFRG